MNIYSFLEAINCPIGWFEGAFVREVLTEENKIAFTELEVSIGHFHVNFSSS